LWAAGRPTVRGAPRSGLFVYHLRRKSASTGTRVCRRRPFRIAGQPRTSWPIFPTRVADFFAARLRLIVSCSRPQRRQRRNRPMKVPSRGPLLTSYHPSARRASPQSTDTQRPVRGQPLPPRSTHRVGTHRVVTVVTPVTTTAERDDLLRLRDGSRPWSSHLGTPSGLRRSRTRDGCDDRDGFAPSLSIRGSSVCAPAPASARRCGGSYAAGSRRSLL